MIKCWAVEDCQEDTYALTRLFSQYHLFANWVIFHYYAHSKFTVHFCWVFGQNFLLCYKSLTRFKFSEQHTKRILTEVSTNCVLSGDYDNEISHNWQIHFTFVRFQMRINARTTENTSNKTPTRNWAIIYYLLQWQSHSQWPWSF